MQTTKRITRFLPAAALLAMLGLGACSNDTVPQAPGDESINATRWSFQDWPTGPYQVVENWPKALPDDRHPHDGWTWGSFGGVYAESPDRIWIAMRGELPLPEGAPPWTPYAALNPSVGNATGNTDGLSASCESIPLRGW